MAELTRHDRECIEEGVLVLRSPLDQESRLRQYLANGTIQRSGAIREQWAEALLGKNRPDLAAIAYQLAIEAYRVEKQGDAIRQVREKLKKLFVSREA